jgi:hypothetical protein
MTRLMCSTKPEEVGAVKRQLFKAGIRSEIRSNPVATALNIVRLELWVENDNDYFAAQKFYNNMVARAGNGLEPTATEDSTESSVVLRDPEASPTRAVNRGVDGENKSQCPGGELEEVSLLLEKEIEEVIEREDALTATCTALRSEVESLNRSLSESQAAAEKNAAEFAALRGSLERELVEHTRSEDQLKIEVREMQSRLKSVQETLVEKQKKLDSTLQQLQTHQANVLELRKEIVSREQEWDENKRLVSKARAELAVERQSRISAEEQVAKSAQAQRLLEKQLVEQKDMQEQLRASIGSLNSLRSRLQAKKNSVRA